MTRYLFAACSFVLLSVAFPGQAADEPRVDCGCAIQAYQACLEDQPGEARIDDAEKDDAAATAEMAGTTGTNSMSSDPLTASKGFD